jgi:hypothetical protein
MAEGKLRPEIALSANVGEIAEVAARLMDRAFIGKAVLTF